MLYWESVDLDSYLTYWFSHQQWILSHLNMGDRIQSKVASGIISSMTISQTFVDNHFQAGKRSNAVASHSLIHEDFSTLASSRICCPESITSFPTTLSKALKISSHNEYSMPVVCEIVL